ncbi:MAG: hypothetical protein DWI57_13995 [Chloroflexi bacterium]|nr:MAG: hypothetical protein DWI57_13995 [Chloroflexota bacterium]
MTATLRLNLLGPPELSAGDAPLTGLRSQKAIALLVYLACNPGPQRREFLADLLWDSATSSAQSLSNLRTVLSRLRGHAGDHLRITPDTLAIAPGPNLLVDVAALEAQMAATSERLSPASAAHLAAALALYRGDFLAGFHLPDASGFAHWVVVERERLRFAVMQNYRRLTDYHLRGGEFPAGLAAAARWLGLEPLDEEAHGQMMRLLAGDGQLAEALTHYERCRHLLHTELDVAPSEELQSLYRQISAQKSTSPAPAAENIPTAPAIPHNLPQRLTSFVGREVEVAAVRDLFAAPATRLVTLVGEGGVGKSSLAVAVGRELLDAWRDGVVYASLVEITPEPDATLSQRLAMEVAEAVGLTFSTARGAGEPTDQLFHFLGNRLLLLILDNFEHLTAGAAFVGDLLQAVSGSRVLITSRQPLGIRGESLLRLDGLPTPPQQAALALSVPAYASVALFVERARQQQHTFAITPDNWEPLRHLCQLVAGNALALELAAAWVEHFSLTEMTTLLETDILDFMHTAQTDVPERHRSLRRVIETSWQLLATPAQRVLAQLSLFRGSFHREAALAVTDAALDGLAQLVNASLLQAHGTGRYELHEVVRQFAAERLAESVEENRGSAERHARYYLALVAGVQRTPERIAQVTEELPNVRQAWHWAVENRDVAGLAAASVGLWNFYLRKGLFQEAEDAFGRGIGAALAAPPGTEGRQRALAALCVAQAAFLNIRNNYTEAIALSQEAIGYALAEEDEALIARGYLQWGTALYCQGRYADALERLQMALLAAQDAGIESDQADILRQLGTTWLEQGDFGAAQARCEAALAIYLRTGNRLGEGNTLNDLGWMNQRQQHFEEARVYLEAAERTHAAINNRHGVTMALINLGIVQQMLGDFSAAYATDQQLFRELGDQPDRYHHSLVNHSLGVLLSRMGDYAPARRHLLAALEIDRSIGDRGGLAWSYNGLGMIHNHLGDPKTGLAYHNSALEIGHEQGARTVEGIALLGIGQDWQALGQWEGARAAYQKALTVQSELKQAVRALESRSGLARTLLALEQPAPALAQVEQILEYLTAQSLRGAAQPALVYWNCYTVLRGLDDPRAPALLAEVYDLVQTGAARIDDQRLRHSYLHAVPAHREILREVESLRLSPPFVGVAQQESIRRHGG